MALTASSQSGSRSTIILVLVIALHLGVFYGIQMGLARKVVQLLPKDIQTKIIKEDKPEEPPPPPPPPPPDIATPPPFVPPPEVSVQVPVQTTAIQTVTNEKPPVVAPPVMAPPAPQPKPGTAPKLDLKKSRSPDEYYPAASNRDNETGSAVIHCFVRPDGKCYEIAVTQSSGFQRLDEAATKYAQEGIRFTPGTTDGVAAGMWYDFKVTFKQKSAR